MKIVNNEMQIGKKQANVSPMKYDEKNMNNQKKISLNNKTRINNPKDNAMLNFNEKMDLSREC